MLLLIQKPFRGIRSALLCLGLGLVLGGCALSEPTSEQLMMRTASVNPDERRASPRPPLREIVDNVEILNTHYVTSSRYERHVVQQVFGAEASDEGTPDAFNPLGLWSGGVGLAADVSDRLSLGIGGVLGDLNATVRVAGPYFFTASHTPLITKNYEFIAQRRLLHPSADHGWGVSLGAYWQRLRLQLGEYVGDANAESFQQRTAGGRLFVRTPVISRGENSQLHVTLISRVGVETEFNTMVVGVGARLTVHVP